MWKTASRRFTLPEKRDLRLQREKRKERIKFETPVFSFFSRERDLDKGEKVDEWKDDFHLKYPSGEVITPAG